MKHKYWLEAVLLCGVMQSAPAQSILKNKDEKELSLLLNEVVVTGTGTEHYLKDAPVQTEVLTGKALEQYAYDQLNHYSLWFGIALGALLSVTYWLLRSYRLGVAIDQNASPAG